MSNPRAVSPWLRAVVAGALLLAWLVPTARLAVLPQQRALEAAATELVCLSARAAMVSSLPGSDDAAAASMVKRPGLADVAAPMQRAFDRQWRTDLTRVLFAAFAAAVLLAGARRAGAIAPLLVIAAASLYLWAHEPHWEAYHLLGVTQSPQLWWHAVSQWSWALQAERLLAPPAVWIALLGASWMLLRGDVTPRRAPRSAPAFECS